MKYGGISLPDLTKEHPECGEINGGWYYSIQRGRYLVSTQHDI